MSKITYFDEEGPVYEQDSMHTQNLCIVHCTKRL